MIKKESIDRLKEQASISAVVGRYVKLDNKGQACCPFHNENTPSFRVTENKGLYKCFGCGESGDSFAFVQKHANMGFADAVKEVAEIMNFSLEYEEMTPEKKVAMDELSQMIELNEQVASWFQNKLLESSQAKDYLAKRGYSVEDAIKMELGFAPDSWDWLKNKMIDAGKLPLAIKLGLVVNKEEKLYDFFRDRIMFVVRDGRGKARGFSGRYIGENDKAPKYLNSKESICYTKETLLFGLHRAAAHIKPHSGVYVVEGNFDVTSCHLKGYMNVVASCGTALSVHAVKILKKYSAKILLLRDGDDAGQKAMNKDIDTVLKAGCIPYACSLENAKDIDELLNKK